MAITGLGQRAPDLGPVVLCGGENVPLPVALWQRWTAPDPSITFQPPTMHPEQMDITVLVIEDCPNAGPAEDNIRAALSRSSTEASIVVRTVTIDTEAVDLGFAGSPTILIDGRDPFPGVVAPSLSCRLYASPEGPNGAPSVDQLVKALSLAGPPEYWAVNNHDPELQPSGRPEIHGDWMSARESLAVDMVSWAAFVDHQAEGVPRGGGWPTMTERVDEVIGDEMAGLQPGSDFTATFVDDATALERTFTLEHMPAIPMLGAGQHQELAGGSPLG